MSTAVKKKAESIHFEAGSAQPGTPGARARLVAAVVLAIAVGAAVFTGLQAHEARASADARSNALAAATTRVPDLLSYEQTTLAEDLARALDQTTGAFTDDFGKILSAVVEPTAKRRGISTEAKVSAAGVTSGTRTEVVVLVFLTQTTTDANGGTTVSGSRVEVTMARSGEGWKVAALDPI